MEQPFWSAKEIHDEPVLFFEKSGWLEGTIIFQPESEIRFKIWSEEGYKEEFTVNRNSIELHENHIFIKVQKPQDDHIPDLTELDLIREINQPNSYPYTRDMKKGLLHSEDGLFHKKQVLASYSTSQSWNGHVPHKNQFICNRVEAIIKKSKKYDIFCFGDSISAGCNCSKQLNLPPFSPSYPEIVQDYLQDKFNATTINLRNYSVGGQNSKWGKNQLTKILRDKNLDYNFDLNFIAWGANDSGGKRSPKEFIKNIKNQVTQILDYNPNAIILLISSSLTNPLWHASHNDFLLKYRDLMQQFVDCCANQVGLVDLSQLWYDLLERKNFYDLTGNGLNHPNDYGHQLYAQSILTTLDLI